MKYIEKDFQIEKLNEIARQENTFLFVPQSRLYENSDIYCKIGEKRVSISPVFAGRLQISDVGVYHADFEF